MNVYVKNSIYGAVSVGVGVTVGCAGFAAMGTAIAVPAIAITGLTFIACHGLESIANDVVEVVEDAYYSTIDFVAPTLNEWGIL